MSDPDVMVRLNRIEEAVQTMAWWLVAAQTGFGERDAQGIRDILSGIRQAVTQDDEDAQATKGAGSC